jgi:hypothetical protein
MRALVVYESMFGNTQRVALAIAAGLRATMQAEAIEVTEASPILAADVELLVVGGPTHSHGLTSPKSRTNAAERAGDRLVTRGVGIREWLDALVPLPSGLAATAFDTRIKGPELLWGSAAKGAAQRLRAHGFWVLPTASFLVGGPTGDPFDRIPEQELERAKAWGEKLAAELAAAPVAHSHTSAG